MENGHDDGHDNIVRYKADGGKQKDEKARGRRHASQSHKLLYQKYLLHHKCRQIRNRYISPGAFKSLLSCKVPVRGDTNQGGLVLQ